MTIRRTMLAASAAVTIGMTLGMLAGVAPAGAQYGYGGGGYGGGYGGYDRPPPPPGYGRRYDPDYDDRPPPPRYGRPRGGSICVTARGNCRYRPQPFNTPCECDIPGFGLKRGAIGG